LLSLGIVFNKPLNESKKSKKLKTYYIYVD